MRTVPSNREMGWEMVSDKAQLMSWNIKHVFSLDFSVLGQIMNKRNVDQETLGIQGTWNKGFKKIYTGKKGKFSSMIYNTIKTNDVY